ncbi:MAG: hypothetical protein IKL46_05020 [Clostridia bacterium]|nr:hypothetical protein [Clostridia bacterium]
MTKTFSWYIQNALSKLKGSNFITTMELDYDTKLGLYYIMKIFNLSFSHCVRGSWEFVMVVKNEDSSSNGLHADEILALPADIKIYNELKAEFESGILPSGAEQTKPKKSSQPFGWLSPTGEFFISEWGTHCTSAENIIKNKNMAKEYEDWELADKRNFVPNDFLCNVKGYVLIHNPSNDGGYVVTQSKPLTKKQREFLYNYFADMGNLGRANMYISDD